MALTDDPTIDLEVALREALTDEAWEKVSDFPDAIIRPDGVCTTCGNIIPAGANYPVHIGWHRRLNLAMRAQGVVLMRVLNCLEPSDE